MTPRIVLHIDRLVLKGVDPGDAAALSSAIRAELQRRLAEPGRVHKVAVTGGRDRIVADRVHVQGTGATGQAAGRAIADQVAHHLVGTGKP